MSRAGATEIPAFRSGVAAARPNDRKYPTSLPRGTKLSFHRSNLYVAIFSKGL